MRAVLLDLDNTIMNNKTIRQNAMTSALQYLDLKRLVKELLLRYEEIVDRGYVFELLGYDNFIHILNSLDLHAVFTVLYTDNISDLKRLKISQDDQQIFIRKIDEVKIKFYDSQFNHPPIDEDLYKNFRKKVVLDPVIQKLTDIVAVVKSYKKIKKAYRAFTSAFTLMPVPGFNEFLNRLLKNGFSLYIISEGIHNIQKKKIKALKLYQYFKHKLLTTELASNKRIRSQIKREKSKLRKKMTGTDAEKVDKKDLEKKLKTLQNYDNILQSYLSKNNPYFYARVLHAIKNNNKTPEKHFSKIPYIPLTQWKMYHPLYVAVIGDRYDKDIFPLIQLEGKKKVLTLLLNQGKYKGTYTDSKNNKKDKNAKPDFIIDNFDEAGDILCNESNWVLKEPVIYKDIFPINRQRDGGTEIQCVKSMETILSKQQKAAQIGQSVYQVASMKFYKQLREIHSHIIPNKKSRILNEKHKKRYINGNYRGIENLYTFVRIFCDLLQHKKTVKGIDYGCGSHYLVHDLYKRYKWDVKGFDSDENVIRIARNNYNESAEKYIYLDLLNNNLPVNNSSQDFVFCNAVIQHFSNTELMLCFQDVYRVLKPGGLFIIIFKRNIKDWIAFEKKYGIKTNVLDQNTGKIEIEDKTIKKALMKLPEQQKEKISSKYYTGMWLLHFFSIDYILKIAKQYHFKVKSKVKMPHGKKVKGVFTYQSGKGIPNAAIIFSKMNG